MAFGGGIFGRRLQGAGGALAGEISALIKESQRAGLSLPWPSTN